MKVLITGATGLIGNALVDLCISEGISVHYLTTRKEKIINDANKYGYYWNPSTDEIDMEAFKGVSTIIHLAGATVSKRWTKKYKKEILQSRIKSANLIYESLKKQDHTITHFISASGIGIYPNCETKLYTEDDNDVNTSFLAKVVNIWEERADQFLSLGIDVTKVRTGMVLANEGGVLPELTKIIKTGLGSPIGSGEQWQSWIHIEDVVNIYLLILKNNLEGVYNAVAPNPVTNKKLTKHIATSLKVSLWLPNIPGFILKFILGEMAVLALEGQMVSSNKIEANGYVFRFSNIEMAMKDLITNQ